MVLADRMLAFCDVLSVHLNGELKCTTQGWVPLALVVIGTCMSVCMYLDSKESHKNRIFILATWLTSEANML